jgi:hypothetical protein
MTATRPALTLLLVLLMSCADDPDPVSPLTDEADAYAVYSAVIDSLFLYEQTEIVVIRSATTPYTLLAGHIQAELGANPSLIDSYHAANADTAKLERRLSVPVPYSYVEADTFDDIIRVGGWSEFYRRYPKAQGYMELSRVGFDAAHSEALVYVSNTVDFLAGAGWAVLLHRQLGRWRLVAWTTVWIS